MSICTHQKYIRDMNFENMRILIFLIIILALIGIFKVCVLDRHIDFQYLTRNLNVDFILDKKPSNWFESNAADERSLLEIELYCISKLAVITSRYFYTLRNLRFLVRYWKSIWRSKTHTLKMPIKAKMIIKNIKMSMHSQNSCLENTFDV